MNTHNDIVSPGPSVFGDPQPLNLDVEIRSLVASLSYALLILIFYLLTKQHLGYSS